MAVPTKLISTSQGFQDAKGNVVANGLLSLTLSQAAEVTASGGLVTTEPLYFVLDANGKITSTAIWFNDELSPSGTLYRAILYASNQVRIIQDFGYWSITGGSPIDLSFMTSSALGGPSIVIPFGETIVTFSATPVFPAATTTLFQITLTGNVTSSTMTGGQAGQIITFKIIQDSAGAHTFAWPSNVKNPTSIDTSPNAINIQSFIFDGTNAYPIGPMTVN